MSKSTMQPALALGKRGMLLLGAVMAAAAMYFATTASSAQAENFCINATLQPFGHSGDRCTAPTGGYQYSVAVVTNERAGCETTVNNGVLLASWTCVGAKNIISSTHNYFQFAHGIIRNNNLSFSGVFSGDQHYCLTEGCGGG